MLKLVGLMFLLLAGCTGTGAGGSLDAAGRWLAPSSATFERELAPHTASNPTPVTVTVVMQGGGGGEAIASLLPEPWRTPATVVLGAAGLLAAGGVRRVQRKLSAAAAVQEGIDDAPPEAQAAVKRQIKKRARARKVNDVIEAELQS